MPTKHEKSFDCVAFKRNVQQEIYEEIKDLTVEQRIRYFNEAARNGPFAKFWHTDRSNGAEPEPPGSATSDDRGAK